MKRINFSNRFYLKSIIPLIIVIIISNNAMSRNVYCNFEAPPPPIPTNNLCANAITLIVGDSCNYQTFDNSLATSSSGVPNPTCGGTLFNDVWFRFQITVPNQHVLIDCNRGTLSSNHIALYKGSCFALNQIGCNNGAIDGMTEAEYTFNSATYPVGTWIYIRLWNFLDFNEGTFSICVKNIVAPTNDECSSSIAINPGNSCDSTCTVNGSFEGATDSGILSDFSDADANDDVWYSFTAETTTEYLSIGFNGFNYTNVIAEILSGNCGSLSIISSIDTISSNIALTGLTIGNSYFIRVYSKASNSYYGIESNFSLCLTNQTSSVSICSGNNPVAGDHVANATQVCVLDGYCGMTSTSYDIDQPGNLSSMLCGGVIDNNSWLKFTANSTSYVLNFTIGNCAINRGIQAVVVGTNDFVNFTSYSTCFNPGYVANGSITASGLTVGQTYYLMIDGQDGDNCEYLIHTDAGDGSLNGFVSNDTSICIGGSALLNASGGLSYQWAPSNTLSNSSIANPVATPNTTTAYIVTITGAICTTIDTVVVSVTPTVASITSNSPICAGSSLNLSVNSGLSYFWSGPNGFNSTIQNPTIPLVTSANNGQYCVTVTYNGGCSATACSNISIGSSFTISVINDTICEGQSATLIASGANNYSWDTSPTDTGNVIVISPTTTTTYTVIGTNGLCSGTGVGVVVVNSNPISIIGSNSPICSGSPLNLYSSGGTFYSWNGPNGFTTTNQNPMLTLTTLLNSGQYCVTITSILGCTTTACTDVTVGSSLNISVVNDTICFGENALLVASGATSYIWNSSPIDSTNTLSVSPTTTTLYTVTGTSGLCSGIGTGKVIVNQLPTPTATNNSPICEGTNLIFTSSGGASYSWNGPDGFVSLLQNPSITNADILSSGIYNVKVTSSDGCSDSIQTNVIINNSPILSVTPLISSICIGDSVVISASGANSYSWYPSQSLNDSTSSIVIVNPENSTTYNVIGHSNNCSDTVSISILVNPLPVIQINASYREGCEPFSTTLSLNSSTEIQDYEWSFGNGNFSNEQSPFVTYLNSNSYTISIHVIDVNGCENDQIEYNYITVNPKPIANFVFAPIIGMVGQSIEFHSENSSANIIWGWDFGDGISVQGLHQNINHSYTTPGSFDVSHYIVNQFGCSDTITKQYFNTLEYKLPNIITPNYDGYNDYFIIEGLEKVDNIKLELFNRWGKKIFEENNYKSDWDGQNYCDGVYYYIITFPNEIHVTPLYGSLTLKKN